MKSTYPDIRFWEGEEWVFTMENISILDVLKIDNFKMLNNANIPQYDIYYMKRDIISYNYDNNTINIQVFK